MKRLRLFLYGVLTLFVLGVIGAGLVSLFFDLNSLKPTLAEAAFEATGRQLTIDGDIELSLFPRPRATATGVHLSNVTGGSEPDVVTIDVASAQVAWLPLLSGTVDVRQIQASGVRVLVEEGAEQTASLAFTPPESTAESDDSAEVSLPDLIRIADISVVRRDDSGDQVLDISSLTVRPAGPAETRIDLTMIRNGERVSASARVGGLLAFTDAEPFPVDLTVEAGTSTLQVKGAIRDPGGEPALDLALSAQGTSIAALSGIVGAPLSMNAPFTFAAQLNGSVDALALQNIAISVGPTQVTGQAILDLTGARPHLSAQLRSPRLEVSQVAGEGVPADENDSASSKGPILTDTPLPFGALQVFDADISIEVTTAEAFGLQFNNLALGVKSAGGLATIEKLSATTDSGAFSASGQLDARTDQAALFLNTQVSGLEVSRVLKTFNIPGTSTQRAGASLELNTRGQTTRNFVDNITASIRLADISVAFDDAATLVLEAATARFGGRDLPIDVTAEGGIRGQTITIDGRLDPLSAYQPGEPYTFEFTVSGAGATAEIQTDMRAAMVDGLSLRVAIRGSRLSDLSQMIGSSLPPVGPYDVQGVVSFDETTAGLRDAIIRVGDSDLQGEVSLSFAADRLAAVADFRAEFIDLTALSAEPEGVTPSPDPVSPAVPNNTPLDVSPFLSIDSEINITADAVALSAFQFDDVSVAIKTDADAIHVERFAANLDGRGIAVSGSARQTSGGLAVSTTGEINGVDVMALLAASNFADRVNVGDLTIDADVSSVGRTLLELVDALKGEIVARDFRLAFKSSDGLVHDPITLDTLRVATTGEGQPVTLESKGMLGGEALEVKGTLAPLAELRLMQPVALDLALETASSWVKIVGTAPERGRPRDLRFSVDAEGLIVREAAYAAGLALDPDGPWQVRGAFETSEKSIDVTNLDIAVGGSDLTGELSVSMSEVDRRIAGRIKSQTFALADFIRVDDADPGQEPTSTPPPSTPAEGPVFSTTPLDFAALRGLELDIGIAVDSFSGRSISGKNLDIAFSGGDGLLVLERLAATVEGRPLTGQARIDLRGDKPAMSASITGGPIDASRLAAEMTGSGDLARRVSIPIEMDIQLQGSGLSPHEIASTATGVVSVTGGKGFVRQKGFRFIDQGLLRQLTPWAKEAGDRTNINCFVTRLDIDEGIATSRAMLLDAEFLSIAGKGTIDLGEETLDLTLTPRPKEVRLLDLAVPISVTGPLHAPTALPTAGGTAKKVVTTLGIFVNPLVLLVPVIEGVTADKNPCLVAIEKAESGETQPTGPVEGVIRGVGRGIGRLLGSDPE